MQICDWLLDVCNPVIAFIISMNTQTTYMPSVYIVLVQSCENALLVSLADGWAFKNNYDINQHQSLEDRLSAAQVLVQSEPLCPVVVDEMTDVTTIKYGALPERLYILQAGKVLYKVRQVQKRAIFLIVSF